MTKNELLRQAQRLMDGGGPGSEQDAYDMGAWATRQLLDGASLDTLHALIKVGPIWDGDLPSKAGRNRLIELGLAAKCVVKGQQGFQVATYRGWHVFHVHIDPEHGTAGQFSKAEPDYRAPFTSAGENTKDGVRGS